MADMRRTNRNYDQQHRRSNSSPDWPRRCCTSSRRCSPRKASTSTTSTMPTPTPCSARAAPSRRWRAPRSRARPSRAVGAAAPALPGACRRRSLAGGAGCGALGRAGSGPRARPAARAGPPGRSVVRLPWPGARARAPRRAARCRRAAPPRPAGARARRPPGGCPAGVARWWAVTMRLGDHSRSMPWLEEVRGAAGQCGADFGGDLPGSAEYFGWPVEAAQPALATHIGVAVRSLHPPDLSVVGALVFEGELGGLDGQVGFGQPAAGGAAHGGVDLEAG